MPSCNAEPSSFKKGDVTVSLFVFVFSILLQQPEGTESVDLRPHWLGFDGKHYVPYDSLDTGGDYPVTLNLDVHAFPAGASLRVAGGGKKVSLFVDNAYTGISGMTVTLTRDSLLALSSVPGRLITIYPEGSVRSLRTTLLVPVKHQTADSAFSPRPVDTFSNFVVVGALVILLMLVMARQLNERLLHDYLSLRQLLMRRESDEVEQFSRIRGSTNLIFYILSAMIVSYLLTIALHFSGGSDGGVAISSGGFAWASRLWLEITAAVLLVFFGKWVIVFSMSLLFNISEIIRNYFFNWMRILLLVVLPLLVLVLLVYFLRDDAPFDMHYGYAFIFLSAAWIIIIFYKLRWRVRFSLFHLISYICVTELIPLLILSRIF